MKKICIITDRLAPDHRLMPLITAIEEDKALELTVLTSCRHLARNMEIHYSAMDVANGDPRQHLDIRIHTGKTAQPHPGLSQDGLYLALKTIAPEIAVVTGNSHEAFSAAIAASLNNIPVAHIHGGERQFGPFEDNFSLGIAKIAILHFTATETYRKRVIGFGEHPDRVFNVGALYARSTTGSPEKSESFNQPVLKRMVRPFLFVSMVPDRSIGSKNAQMAASVMTALDDPLFEKYSLVCLDPGPKGFARIMKAEMKSFICDTDKKLTFIRSDLEIACAMTYADAVIGNTDDCVVLGARMKTPVVSVGDRIKFRDNPGHMIQADMTPDSIKTALSQALCPSFKTRLLFWESPFDKPDTQGRIKEILKSYTPADIRRKAYIL